MRVAISPHHTNPRSSTLDFWRKTTDIERYRVIQAQKKKQINIPTRWVISRYSEIWKIVLFWQKFWILGSKFYLSSNMNKQEHLIIAHRLAEMEKRRIGTRFLDHEVCSTVKGASNQQQQFDYQANHFEKIAALIIFANFY